MPFGGFIVLGFMAAFLKWFSGMFLEQEAQMAFGIRRTVKRKAPTAVESVSEQTQTGGEAQEAEPEQPQASAEEAAQAEKAEETEEDAAENPAEAFYEQASDDPDAELTDEMFSTLDFSVQAQVDAILESIEGASSAEKEADTDA